MRKSILLSALVVGNGVKAWTPRFKPATATFQTHRSVRKHDNDKPAGLSDVESARGAVSPLRPEAVALVSSLPIVFTPHAASAATAFTSNAIPSALAAYGHYISLLGILGCIMVRVTNKCIISLLCEMELTNRVLLNQG